MKRVLVFQHVDVEGPGLLGEELRAEGVELDCIRMDLDEPYPRRLEEYGGFISLGGPMAVYERDRYPWMEREMHLLSRAARSGWVVLGVCLGAQLLAAALGGHVYPAPRKEIGCYRVELTPEGEADPLFAGLGSELTVFQWHGDTFSLPPEAVLLASSSPPPLHQAFRVGERAYGLQFHLEVSPAMVEEWARVYGSDLGAVKKDPEELVREFLTVRGEVEKAGRLLARNLAGMLKRTG